MTIYLSLVNIATEIQPYRAVREQLLIAYAEDIINAEEFVLLYDANQSKPI